MKLLALTILLFFFGFSNCEPVVYENNRPRAKSERKESRQSDSALTARVVGISDGDSIIVLLDGNVRKRVRLATIDAPENHQAFGRPSRKSLSDLIYNKTVQVQTVDEDQYGRIVGEIFVDGTNVNLEQIKRGFAWHYKAHARQQSKEKRNAYATAESEARSKRAGLWRDKDPTPPWKFRKNRKGNER